MVVSGEGTRLLGNNPANTGHSPNAVLMLGQRRRRFANIETASGECQCLLGMCYSQSTGNTVTTKNNIPDNFFQFLIFLKYLLLPRDVPLRIDDIFITMVIL